VNGPHITSLGRGLLVIIVILATPGGLLPLFEKIPWHRGAKIARR
jgi:hypothetical protein